MIFETGRKNDLARTDPFFIMNKNTIALLPYNAQDFPNAIDTGDRPVQIGDTFDGEKFYREGKEVHTEVEEKDITIDRMNSAGAEAMQSLKAEPPVSAGVFTWQFCYRGRCCYLFG